MKESEAVSFKILEVRVGPFSYRLHSPGFWQEDYKLLTAIMIFS